MSSITGHTALFTYPNYGTPDNYPDYTAHSGQEVQVLQRLIPPQVADDVEMYIIKAADGWQGHAHRDELQLVGEKSPTITITLHDGIATFPDGTTVEVTIDQIQNIGLIKQAREALEGLLRNSPNPQKNVRTSFHYRLHLELAKNVLKTIQAVFPEPFAEYTERSNRNLLEAVKRRAMKELKHP